jgi:hypothetical protein
MPWKNNYTSTIVSGFVKPMKLHLVTANSLTLSDFDGLTEQADAIINGECISHMGIPMNRELQVLLEECKRPSNVPEISAYISLEDFKKCVKRWKETTSTSPS